MNDGLSPKLRRDVLKMLDLEHLNDTEFQLLRERKLDKDSMCWATGIFQNAGNAVGSRLN